MMYRNLFLTMVLSGLWHGAAWTFVIWGTLHALGAMLTRRAERSLWYRELVPRFVKQLLVFGFVCFTWIFFRAKSLGDAWLIVTRLATMSWSDPSLPLLAILLMGSVWIYQFVYESRLRWLLEFSMVRVATVVLMVLYLFTIPGTGSEAFIYFQF
jgi:hypothetical protein